jgi:hypothetical protein
MRSRFTRADITWTKGPEMYLAEFSRNTARGRAHSRRMRRRGTANGGSPLWTTEETEICQSLYPDYNAMRAALPHRSRTTLKFHCSSHGIANKMRVYTAKENALFRKLYRSSSARELRAAFPDVSPTALHTRGQYITLSSTNDRKPGRLRRMKSSRISSMETARLSETSPALACSARALRSAS